MIIILLAQVIWLLFGITITTPSVCWLLDLIVIEENHFAVSADILCVNKFFLPSTEDTRIFAVNMLDDEPEFF